MCVFVQAIHIEMLGKFTEKNITCDNLLLLDMAKRKKIRKNSPR